MQTQRLGSTDLELTRIGLGTWAIGGGDWRYGWGPQDEKDSLETITAALEGGINWIDTAPIYGLGRAEEVVAKAIKEFGHRPIIATKCGLTWNAKRKVIPRLTAESVATEVEASLRRLEVETIDLYQIHWPNPESEIDVAWEIMQRLIDQGKIRYAAVCNFDVAQMKQIRAVASPAALQPPYSMIRREIEEEMLGFCGEHDIGVICYSPLQKGVLTDKFSRAFVDRLPGQDHRRISDSNFKEPGLSANLKLVDALRTFAGERNLSVPDLAINWVLRRPEVTAAIVGARRPAQIADNLQALTSTLSGADLAEIDRLLSENGPGSEK